MIRQCHYCNLEINNPEAMFCPNCGVQLLGAKEPPDPLLGQVIAGRYRLLARIGQGGMGIVYRAEHVKIRKLLAVKLLHGQLSQNKLIVKRFQREAEIISRLTHINTVQVFDFGNDKGIMYIAMEHIKGIPLSKILHDRGPLSLKETIEIFSQVSDSLQEAHEIGVIHRDLKPENILLIQLKSYGSLVKVVDFGLAKLCFDGASSDLTHHGTIIGTPHYMSPEQIKGEEIDQRVDIYSAGAVIYRMLTNSPPFSGITPIAILTKHLTEEVPSISNDYPQLPKKIDDIIYKAMAKHPRNRYRTIKELKDDLISLNGKSTQNVSSMIEVCSTIDVSNYENIGGKVIEVYTRGEFDKYEKKLQWRNRINVFLGLTFLFLIFYGIYFLLVSNNNLINKEKESNNSPDEANKIIIPQKTNKINIKGFMGKRIDKNIGDRDWFLLKNEISSKKVLQVEITPIPNMDLVLEIINSNMMNSIIKIDNNGVGQGEKITGVLLSGYNYYILVRQKWIEEQIPVENISDEYNLKISLLDSQNWESEPNDIEYTSNQLNKVDSFKGFIGKKGDTDYYCFKFPSDCDYINLKISPPKEIKLKLFQDETEELIDSSKVVKIKTDSCFYLRSSDDSSFDTKNYYEIKLIQEIIN